MMVMRIESALEITFSPWVNGVPDVAGLIKVAKDLSVVKYFTRKMDDDGKSSEPWRLQEADCLIGDRYHRCSARAAKAAMRNYSSYQSDW